jgi:hypothetical protein
MKNGIVKVIGQSLGVDLSSLTALTILEPMDATLALMLRDP